MKLFQGILIFIGSLFLFAGIVSIIFFVSALRRSLVILTITLIVMGIGLIIVAYRMNKQIQYNEDSKVVDRFLEDVQQRNKQ